MCVDVTCLKSPTPDILTVKRIVDIFLLPGIASSGGPAKLLELKRLHLLRSITQVHVAAGRR